MIVDILLRIDAWYKTFPNEHSYNSRRVHYEIRTVKSENAPFTELLVWMPMDGVYGAKFARSLLHTFENIHP